MPTIKPYGPSRVTTQVASQARARNAPAGAFGGAVAQGLGNAAVEYERVQDDISTTEARDALNTFQKSEMSILTDPENGYYGTSGNNAYTGAQPTIKSLSDLKASTGASLSDSARKKFEASADQRIASASMNVNRHAARGYKEWKVSGFDSEIENNLEEASMAYDNDPQFKKAITAGSQAVYERASLAGVDPKEAVETFKAEFVKNAVLAAINEGSAKADEVLTKHVTQLGGEGPTYNLLKGKIAAKKQAEQTQYETSYALAKSTAINDTYGEDRNAIRDAVNTITDPTLREKTMKQSMVEFNRRKTAATEQRSEIFDSAQVSVNSPQGLNAWIAQNPEDWEKLEPIERQKLESGKTVQTDWLLLNELNSMSVEELAKVNPAEYFLRLAEPERKYLMKEVSTAKGGKQSIGRTRAATNSSNLEIMFGKKKSSWNNDDRANASKFLDLLEVERESRSEAKGSDLSSVEYNDMVKELTSKSLTEGTFWGTNESDFTDFEDDNASKYAQWLRDRKYKVNIDSLNEAKKQNVLNLN